MTKLIAIGLLGIGLFLGNGWKDAGEIVYDKIQQTVEASEQGTYHGTTNNNRGQQGFVDPTN